MRLCTPLFFCLAVAAVVLGPVGVVHGKEATLDCALSDGRDFPLGARIHGGPTSYEAGGGFGTWYIDLVNTTDRACTAVHPVVVLVDDKRVLKPEQARMEFYDGSHAHPVHFESTDEAEVVGAFDDGFPGFVVGPRKTVSVKVGLTVTSDAVPNEVTAKAAVVERRGDDGEWLGESGDYRFGIDMEPGTEPEPEQDPAPRADTTAATLTPGPTPTATPTTTAVPDPDPDPDRDPTPGPDPSAYVASSPNPSPDPSASPDGLTLADELARTGLGTVLGVLGAAVLLLAAGSALVLVARRR